MKDCLAALSANSSIIFLKPYEFTACGKKPLTFDIKKSFFPFKSMDLAQIL
jgi:hypothetical protein